MLGNRVALDFTCDTKKIRLLIKVISIVLLLISISVAALDIIHSVRTETLPYVSFAVIFDILYDILELIFVFICNNLNFRVIAICRIILILYDSGCLIFASICLNFENFVISCIVLISVAISLNFALIFLYKKYSDTPE